MFGFSSISGAPFGALPPVPVNPAVLAAALRAITFSGVATATNAAVLNATIGPVSFVGSATMVNDAALNAVIPTISAFRMGGTYPGFYPPWPGPAYTGAPATHAPYLSALAVSNTIYNPPAGQWAAFRVGDFDIRTKDFGPYLSLIPDTIQDVLSVTISRQDGVVMGVDDLAIASEPGIDTTGYLVTCEFVGGEPNVPYTIEIVVARSGGLTIGRDTLMMVLPSVG